MKPFLLIFCLLLTACVGQTSDLSGFQPLPDEFLGEWEPYATNVPQLNIKQTPTGAISTEHAKSYDDYDKDRKIRPVTMVTTFKVFAIEYNKVYAIGHWLSTFDDTGKIDGNPSYSYYVFEFGNNGRPRFKDEITIYKDQTLPPSDVNYMDFASGLHRHRIQNWPCHTEPLDYCNRISTQLTYGRR